MQRVEMVVLGIVCFFKREKTLIGKGKELRLVLATTYVLLHFQ